MQFSVKSVLAHQQQSFQVRHRELLGTVNYQHMEGV